MSPESPAPREPGIQMTGALQLQKSAFFLKFEKNENLLFFSIQAQIRGFFSQSGGLDLNCHVLNTKCCTNLILHTLQHYHIFQIFVFMVNS